MQIAQIVPKSRTTKEGIFDYAIPPELLPMIKIGILVEVPFHGRKIKGLIIRLKPKSQISNLKSIIDVIDPMPVIDEVHINLAKWMSEYYLSPLGKTLFEMIVPSAKRTIQRLSQNQNYTSRSARAYYKGYFSGKKYIIVSDFKNRLNFYLKAIEKTLKQNRSVIILVPDLSLVRYFTKDIKIPVSILHASLTLTQRWLAWNKIRNGEIKIVIGSTSALFAPVQNLGLLIIDQEENETYKNDRSPRFHVVSVAEKLAELSKANLIIGTITPRIETYNKALEGNYQILKKLKDASDISTVNMNFEKQAISMPLQKKIDEVLKEKKKVLLVLNRKGEGTKFSCPDCSWVALCKKCGLPLVPQKVNNVCFRCEKEYQFPEACPKCQNVHLKPMGLGTIRLKKFVADFWPDAKIVQIEKDVDINILYQDWDIAISTSFGLKFNLPKIGLVGIVDADQELNFPDFHSAEKTFQTFYKFLRIGEQGIIQTHLPENYVFSNLASLDYEKFFLDEIENRRKSQFPPFVQLIRLLYKNTSESVVKEETQRVFDQLLTFNYQLSTILGPSPAFFKKERNKFRYQIILKLKKRSKVLDDFLWTLPKDWIIDVDPIDLL